MNYYPAGAGWSEMWTHYSHARTAADYRAIASLGANAVRVIVQPNAVGYPTVKPSMLSRFHDMLATARTYHLSVQLTLFDWWANYGDIAGSKQWVHSLLSGERANATIALVELRNELPVQSTPALNWARTMLPVLHQALPHAPRTVSAAGTAGVAGIVTLVQGIPRSMLDVIDVHYYGEAAAAMPAIRAAQNVAGGRPVIIGEAGTSTADGHGADEAQARFFRMLGTIAASANLPPPAPWVLSDFTSSGIPGGADRYQYHYGLRRTDGSWKPAAAVVRKMFAGAPLANWDGGFERESNGSPVLGSWRRFDPSDGLGVITGAVRRTGRTAVCFNGTSGRPGAVPSVEQAFPVLHSGGLVRVTGYVHRSLPTGTEHISLAWFNARGRYLGQSESLPAVGSGSWLPLTVTAAAPATATLVQVHLKSAYDPGRACFDDVDVTL